MAERRLLHRPQARWDLPGGPLFPCGLRVPAERVSPWRLRSKPHRCCSREQPFSCLCHLPVRVRTPVAGHKAEAGLVLLQPWDRARPSGGVLCPSFFRKLL